MNTLREMRVDYLAMRRALGFKLVSDGKCLLGFVMFMERANAAFITSDLALAWARDSVSQKPARWAARLCYVRVFARYCRVFDPRTQVPAIGILPFSHRRSSPYHFTEDQVHQLTRSALDQPSKDGFSNHAFHTLFGLLSVAGLRIGEALNLTLDDVDLTAAELTILSGKFGKSRVVPLHASTVEALTAYRSRRDSFLGRRASQHWFVGAGGTRLSYDRARTLFRRLTRDLPEQTGRARPRLHDLRHHFAMRTLLNWYADGEDVERRLPSLSAFLGHVEIRDTYWYLSACPELLDAARARLDQRWESAR